MLLLNRVAFLAICLSVQLCLAAHTNVFRRKPRGHHKPHVIADAVKQTKPDQGQGGSNGNGDKQNDGQIHGGARDIPSVFGAGCRWDQTSSNIEQVSFTFESGVAPKSDWYADVHRVSTVNNNLARRDAATQSDPTKPATTVSPAENHPSGLETSLLSVRNKAQNGTALLDDSYHTNLIDVLTYRARYGYFGSSLNSAGCALPAFSQRLAELEQQEAAIINEYNSQHPSNATPSAMFFWAGLSNADPSVKSDLIQTVVFYGDGCAADPSQGLCVYAAEYSNFRYDANSHMCMGSNLPIFYRVNAPMQVIYSTQRGFRTQEAWIDNKMVSYLRSAGDQIMNSFVITQECKACTWPITIQKYSNIILKFSNPEPNFDKLGACTGGAIVTTPPRPSKDLKTWTIDQVIIPAGQIKPDDDFWGTKNNGSPPAKDSSHP